MKHILVIDDDQVVLAMAEDTLSEAGFKVSTAECGIYSNHIIYSKTPPDLIVMDVMMPLMSGVKKSQILKQREKSRQIPIVLISAKEKEELAQLTTEACADDFLPKPFTGECLVDKAMQHVA
ncbi:MAG: response regulator [Desulfuromonadales bacterium]|nr:response regulator [Desulfuromonadales bacterium]